MQTPTLSQAEFEALGSQLFGGSRWGSKMAERTGLSTALISNIRTGRVEISPKTAAKVRALAGYAQTVQARPEVEIPERGEGVTRSLVGTPLEGDASFEIRLIAKDLVSKRFVKLEKVNPALLFPALAPPPAPLPYPMGTFGVSPLVCPVDPDAGISDEEMMARINSRFAVMERVARSIIAGNFPAMIVYGPPGLGKSYLIMQAIMEALSANPRFYYDLVKGAIRAPGMYKALWNARKGGIVVLDDTKIADEDSMDLLKAALDTVEERRISWRKESAWLKDLAGNEDEVVTDFNFDGGMIYITNENLRARADAGDEDARALISRSLYIDLTMDSIRARTLRVQTVFPGMAGKMGLTLDQAQEIMAFITEYKDQLSEVSLRMANIIARVYLTDPQNWQETVRVTKMKGTL